MLSDHFQNVHCSLTMTCDHWLAMIPISSNNNAYDIYCLLTSIQLNLVDFSWYYINIVLLYNKFCYPHHNKGIIYKEQRNLVCRSIKIRCEYLIYFCIRVTNIHVSLCVYVCVCVLSMYIYVYIYTHAHTHTHTQRERWERENIYEGQRDQSALVSYYLYFLLLLKK